MLVEWSGLGPAMTTRGSLELAAWPAARDAVIIGDGYDAEFRYDRDPVGALQGIAADRIIAPGTVSKSLAPAVRLAWMLCPPALAAPIAERKRRADRGSPVPPQLVIGFGNTGERAIQAGIAAVGGLLEGRARR